MAGKKLKWSRVRSGDYVSWDAKSGAYLRVLHKDGVRATGWAPGWHLLVSGTAGGGSKVHWRFGTLREAKKMAPQALRAFQGKPVRMGKKARRNPGFQAAADAAAFRDWQVAEGEDDFFDEWEDPFGRTPNLQELRRLLRETDTRTLQRVHDRIRRTGGVDTRGRRSSIDNETKLFIAMAGYDGHPEVVAELKRRRKKGKGRSRR